MKRLIIILNILILLALPVQAQETEEPNLDISLSWTTNTFLPENYPGKALPIKGSRIFVVATILNKETSHLNFVWYLDDIIQKYASGLAKDTFNFVASEWPGYEHRVTLKINDLEGYFLTQESINIIVNEPEVHVYVDDKSIRQYEIKPGENVQFRAVPYYFNVSAIDQIKYSWKFEGQETSEIIPTEPNIFNLAISQESRTDIARDLTLRAENKNNYLERARVEALIKIK